MKNIFKISAKIDLWLILIGLSLSIIGIFFVYSANLNKDPSRYVKQIASLVISIVFYVFLATYDYKRLTRRGIFFYFLGLFLLLLTLIFGVRVNNSKSWIKVLGFSFQTSEICKIFFIISFASFIEKFKDNVRTFSFIVISFCLLVPYIGLLLLQPDFGTTLVFILIGLIMLFISGANFLYIVVLVSITGLAIAISFLSYVLDFYSISSFLSIIKNTSFLILLGSIFLVIASLLMLINFKLLKPSKKIFYTYVLLFVIGLGVVFSIPVKIILKDYHYKRLIVLFDPDIDPLGKGYNIRQSLISIGSGKFLGQGFTKGRQNRGNFLPSEDTDFIVSVIAEETGFLGVSILLILFFLLVYKSLHIAFSSRDFTGCLVGGGISAMYISHITINLLSATGLFPIVGIPLSFVSYGGSSLVTNFIGLGILFNIESKKFTYISV